MRCLFLIPGALLLIFGALGILGSGEDVASNSGARKQAIQEFRAVYTAKGVSRAVLDDIIADGGYRGPHSRLSSREHSLMPEMEVVLLSINSDLAISTGVSVITGGLGITMLIGGLVFISSGLLIGIKKWKLVCDKCRAATEAA